MIVRPITPDAALFVAANMRESDRREIFATRGTADPVELAAQAAALGPLAYVAGADGEPIACFGTQEVWPGVWQAWLFATDSFNKIGFRLTRFIKRVIVPATAAAGAHRVHCYSIEGHDEAHRWLAHLGAVREATLRRYGRGGEDFHVFRWLRAAED